MYLEIFAFTASPCFQSFRVVIKVGAEFLEAKNWGLGLGRLVWGHGPTTVGRVSRP